MGDGVVQVGLLQLCQGGVVWVCAAGILWQSAIVMVLGGELGFGGFDWWW